MMADRGEVSMYGFTTETVNVAAIRERLAKMSDEALKRYGRAAAFMAGRNDRETWRVQLKRRGRSGADGRLKPTEPFCGFTSNALPTAISASANALPDCQEHPRPIFFRSLQQGPVICSSRMLKKSSVSLLVETKARLYVWDAYARNRYPTKFDVQLSVAGRARTGESSAAADSDDGR
jgi:hypothetical protein